MIPPMLIVVGVAGKPIPLPMVRLEGTTPRQRAALPLAAWRLLAAARGLRIDVRSADGTRVYVRCW